MKIQDIVDAALAARLDHDATGARADRLKAAAVAAAERLRLEVGLVDRFPSQQGLGNLRLDGADAKAAVRIEKPAEVADWLAQRRPDLTVATLTVPAARLQDLLDAAEFSDIPVTAEIQLTGDGQQWVKDNCHPVAVEGGWVARAVLDGAPEEVPGLSASRPAPRWVLTADPKVKKLRTAEAVQDAELELGGDQPEPAVVPAPRSAVDDDASERIYRAPEGITQAEALGDPVACVRRLAAIYNCIRTGTCDVPDADIYELVAFVRGHADEHPVMQATSTQGDEFRAWLLQLIEGQTLAELASDYSVPVLMRLRKDALQQRCRDLGLDPAGNKDVLAARVSEHAKATLA
jgi:hypothetical protein